MNIKTNERVIVRENGYYQLETMQDIMMQQKLSKKEEIQSSTIIPMVNENIVTELPPRSEALKNYSQQTPVTLAKSEDHGLMAYKNQLEQLLRQPIKDEQRLQIEKLLKQIAEIHNDGELPLNKVTTHNKEVNQLQPPKQINIISELNTQKLQSDIVKLENIKYIELSKLENLVQILLGDPKLELPVQAPNQMDIKTKQQIEAVYNNLNQLKCLNNFTGIINKISANETKYVEMAEWTAKTERVNQVNKEILDELENDGLMLKQLEENFKKNIESVRAVVKKLASS